MPRGYIAVSTAVRDVLVWAGVAGDRIVVVHDGVAASPIDAAEPIDVRALLGLPNQARIVLAAGALVTHKAHEIAIHAMTWLDSDVHLVIAGEGPKRNALEEHVRIRALEGRVHLIGHRVDLPRLLKGVDLFCHPLMEEGFGQVLIEARLAGLPVVGTRAGGVVESAGEDARLVEVGEPRAIAAAIRTMLADLPSERLRSRRGVPAVRAAFSVEAMVNGTMSAYRHYSGAPFWI
jgi:glycosyltransferase involved in cell wall biosynthesis